MDEQAYRDAEAKLWDSLGRQPAERQVVLPRLGVRVRVQEVGEGEPVLYLHGGPSSGSVWAPMAAHLDGFRSLLLDRPGTGLSEPMRVDATNATEVADLFVGDVLDALGLERAHVVASSLGGWLALRSAAAAPERFDRMVQMACPAGAPGMAMPPFIKAATTPGLGRLIAALPPNPRASRMTLRQIGHRKSLDAGRIPQVFHDWSLALQRHTSTTRNELRLLAQAGSPLGWAPLLLLTEDLLARVETPTYFWWGADDTFGGEKCARRLVEMLPDARLEMVPDAGHLPWLDDPARAARAVGAFLSERLAASGAGAS